MCLFIGDIGDNKYERYDDGVKVYRVAEPLLSEIEAVESITRDWQVGLYTYPDQAHNAESMLIDVNARQLIIPTKSDPQAKVFQASLDLQNNAHDMLVDTGNLI